ncbi:uncharacterized protein LOC111135134 [Crassostrea virginica]
MGSRRTLCFFFLGSFLSSFLLLYDCTMLDGYKFPVYTTDFCPRNEIEWKKRSSAFNCSKDSSYACLPNEDITVLLEFCYPLQNIAIQEGLCLFLKKDVSVVDSYDCTHFQYGCPPSPYTGATVYKYPNCVLIGNRCFLAEVTCKSPRADTNITDGGGNDLVLILGLFGMAVLLCVFGFFLFYIIRTKIRTRQSQNVKENEGEDIELLMPNKEITLQCQQNSQQRNQQTMELNPFFSQDKDSDARLADNGEPEHPGTSSVRKNVSSSQIVQNQEIRSTVPSSDSPTTIQNEIFMYENTPETVNMFRIVQLILDLCNAAMRDLMQSKIPGGELGLTKKIACSKKYLASSRLSKDQERLLFPPNNAQVQYQSLDFTIMYALVRNIFHEEIEPNSKKNNKWGKRPNAGEVGLVVAIENIRWCRNAFFAHAPSTKVDEKTFDVFWTAIEGAVEEIDKHIKPVTQKCYKEEANKMIEEYKEYKKLLKKEEETYKNFGELMAMRGKGDKKTEGRIEKDCLDKWEHEDKVFVPTRATDAVEKMIETKRYVIVSGHSGSGKSAIIQHIALKYRKKGWVVKPVEEINQIIKAYESEEFEENMTLFVIDDPIGNGVFDDLLHRSWKNHAKRITLFLHKVKLLMTCRKQILSDSRTSGLFVEKDNIIEIDDVNNNLCEDEKLQIFLKRMPNYNFTRHQMEELLSVKTLFPLLCKLSAYEKDKSFNNIKHVFTNPDGIISKQIKEFRENDKKKYCALVCLFFFKNKLSATDLQKKEHQDLFNKCLTMSGIRKGTPIEIIRSLKPLEGFFVKSIDGIYQFYHDFIMEVTTCVFGKEYPLEIINEADLSVLRKRIRIGPDKSNAFTILLSEKYIVEIVNRFFDGLFSERFMEVVLNPCLKNENVVRTLILKMKNNRDILKTIICERQIHTEDKYAQIRKYKEERDAAYKEKNEEHCDTQRNEYSFSNIDFVNKETKCSPLFALITFGHDDLAQFAIDTLKDMNTNFTGKKLLCAVCFNGSENLFQSFIDQKDSYVFIHEHWGDLYPIHIAALFQNDSLLIKLLDLDRGGNIMIRTLWEEKTPLHLACANGHLSTVSHLLARGAYINDINLRKFGRSDKSLLSTACLSGNESIVQLLLEKGANINPCLVFEGGPLYHACKTGKKTIVGFLLEKGADVNLFSYYKKSPLYEACKLGHESIVLLLIENGANVNLLTRCKGSPPFEACREDSCAQTRFDDDFAIKICLNHAKSPLYAAIQNGNENIVRLLLDKGADINLCSEYAGSPLYEACINGYENIILLLLGKGAQINLCSEYRGSPLHAACIKGNESNVRLLLENGADINSCLKYAGSPLYAACVNDNESIVHLLLENNADVNLCSEYKGSPLYAACKKGNESIVQILLEKGADVYLCSKYKGSPLHAACENGDTSIVQLLLQQNVDVNLCLKDIASPLYSACKHGNESIVHLLVKNGADVNLCSEEGSPLYAACRIKNESIVDLLLKKGADVNLCSKDKTSPLYAACKIEDIRIVNLLVKKGARINPDQENEKTPLYAACKRENESIVHFLLENGADVNLSTTFDSSPFLAACKGKNESIVSLLMEKGADVNLYFENKGNALHAAFKHGNVNVVRLLLNKDADVNLCSEDEGTPLYAACKIGDENIVRLLLDKGAKINLCSKNNKSPLLAACEQYNDNIVLLLLDKGADVNLCSEDEGTPLYAACKIGHENIVRLLLDKGAKINLCSKNNKSPLLAACEQYDDNIVLLLLDKGADVNLCSEDEGTPLYAACKIGHENIVRLLLDKGAKINLCSKNNKSPLLAACEQYDENIVLLLLDKGADVNLCSEDEGTPLYAACKIGHENIVRLLLDKGANINLCSKNDESPLLAACKRGHENIALLLMDKGAELNSKTLKGDGCYAFGKDKAIDLFFDTSVVPLCAACAKGYYRIVEGLLEKGADPNFCENGGLTPLFVASYKGLENIVQLLLKHGAKVSSRINLQASPNSLIFLKHRCRTIKIKPNQADKETSGEDTIFDPLFAACFKGHSNIVHLLLANGAEVNKHGKNGFGVFYMAYFLRFKPSKHLNIKLLNFDRTSPLYAACYNKNYQLVQILLENGADVNSFPELETTFTVTGLPGKTKHVFFKFVETSPLYKVCKYGERKIAEVLIQNGADVNFCSQQEGTPLYAASECGDYHLVEFLLHRGAKVNLSSQNVGSPLHAACRTGSDKIINVLLENGADINLCFQQVGTPLYVACDNRRNNIIRLLLEKGADVKKCSENLGSPLHAASKNGSFEIVKLLLDKGAEVNLCSVQVGCPLYSACKHGRTAIVQLLLECGAEVNSFTELVGSPLYAACKCQNSKIVHILLEKGAEVNLFSQQAGSPLYAACGSTNVKIVNLLLEKKADINICSEQLGSPLYAACKNECFNIVKLLLDHDAEVNTFSEEVGSPVHGACEKQEEEEEENAEVSIHTEKWEKKEQRLNVLRKKMRIIELLLDSGAKVNSFSEKVGSPLHTACENNYDELVQFLLEKGAEVNVFSRELGSPLHVACKIGQEGVVQQLLDKGAEINTFSEHVQSPLHIACENGHFNIVKILVDNGAKINQFLHDRTSPLYQAFQNGHDRIVKYLLGIGAEVDSGFDNINHPLLTEHYSGKQDSAA